LESFLLDFPGCLIVVSHDRYFMDKIVDHLFVFRGAGQIDDFPGNYSDFRIYEDSQPKEEKTKEAKGKSEWKNPKAQSSSLSYNEQKEFKRLERDIARLEEEKAAMEIRFTAEDITADEITQLSIELNALSTTIEDKTERWFELSLLND